MELSITERLMLSNQYLILEKLYPERAEEYAECKKVIDRGYEAHYRDYMRHIRPDVMTNERSSEVLDILSMYEALKDTYDSLDNAEKMDIDERNVSFPGFSGNSEADLLAYARYCVEDRKSSQDLGIKCFSSHYPTIDSYRRMLDEWHATDNKHRLSKDDVIRIIAARVHPDNR